MVIKAKVEEEEKGLLTECIVVIEVNAREEWWDNSGEGATEFRLGEREREREREILGVPRLYDLTFHPTSLPLIWHSA